MITYIVQGRHFESKCHALSFAARLASEQETTVDIEYETTDVIQRKQRAWMCRVHPEGTKLPFLLRREKNDVSVRRSNG